MHGVVEHVRDLEYVKFFLGKRRFKYIIKINDLSIFNL